MAVRSDWQIVGGSELPDDAQNYKSTPVFDAGNLPPGLQSVHKTKAGTWGLAIVHRGRIDFIDSCENVTRISQGEAVVIEPEAPHRVRLCGPVAFQVAFYRVT